MVARRTIKTLFYKASVILITQIALFLLFDNIIINTSMALIEIIRIVWYYIYDWLFEEKIWRPKEYSDPFPIIEAYPQTSYVHVVDIQGRLLCKCPECEKEFTKEGIE